MDGETAGLVLAGLFVLFVVYLIFGWGGVGLAAVPVIIAIGVLQG